MRTPALLRPLAARAVLAVTGAAAASVAVTGCRAVVDRAFQQPTLTFTSANLRGVGPAGGTIDVVAVVHNSNPYPLRAASAHYRLVTAEGMEVGRGEVMDSLSVRARDSAVLVLPVNVTLAGLVRAGAGVVAGAAGSGAAEYRVLGDVVLAHTPVGDVRVPIDVRGRATLAPRGGAASVLGGALGGILGGR